VGEALALDFSMMELGLRFHPCFEYGLTFAGQTENWDAKLRETEIQILLNT